MLILTATTDLLEAGTSTAATLDVHVSYADLNAGTVTPARKNTAISSATNTDISGSPAGSTQRNVKTVNIRNKDASLSCDVTVRFNQNSTIYELFKATLRPGDVMEYIEGIGWFVVSSSLFPLKNQSVSALTISTSDIYLVGSSISFPSNLPVVGTLYHCVFTMNKTAGTGSPVVTVRIGTGGAVTDTVGTAAFTFGVGTSVADTAVFEVWALFRTVGSGTSAVMQVGFSMIPNLAATGFGGTTPIRAGQTTSAGFASTGAGNIIGVSFNGSTAFAGTAQLVRAELIA